MSCLLIAIDTGAKGAVAALLPNGEREVYGLPVHPVGVYNLLRRLHVLASVTAGDQLLTRVCVESLTGGHGMGSKGTFFKQGFNYGSVVAMVELFATETQGVFVDFTKADKWQKAITRQKKETLGSYAKWKSFLATLAKDRYSKTITCYDEVGALKKSLTNEVCDAVLILQYLEGKYA